MLEKNARSASVFLNSSEPKPGTGGKKLLFDRLIDDNPNLSVEHPKKTLLSKEKVIESIVNEIDRLLNTRLSATAKIYAKYRDMEYGMGLPWMYGIPDFTSIDAADKTGWARLAKIFTRAIAYFEPRLKAVKVTIERFDGTAQSLHVTVRGQALAQNYLRPVFFGVRIRDLAKG